MVETCPLWYIDRTTSDKFHHFISAVWAGRVWALLLLSRWCHFMNYSQHLTATMLKLYKFRWNCNQVSNLSELHGFTSNLFIQYHVCTWDLSSVWRCCNSITCRAFSPSVCLLVCIFCRDSDNSLSATCSDFWELFNRVWYSFIYHSKQNDMIYDDNHKWFDLVMVWHFLQKRHEPLMISTEKLSQNYGVQSNSNWQYQ